MLFSGWCAFLHFINQIFKQLSHECLLTKVFIILCPNRNKIRIICWQMLKYLVKCEQLFDKIWIKRFVKGNISSYDSILRINMWLKLRFVLCHLKEWNKIFLSIIIVFQCNIYKNKQTKFKKDYLFITISNYYLERQNHVIVNKI